MQAFIGLALMIMRLEAEHLACRRWHMAQHSNEVDVRIMLAFALPLAGFILMWPESS